MPAEMYCVSSGVWPARAKSKSFEARSRAADGSSEMDFGGAEVLVLVLAAEPSCCGSPIFAADVCSGCAGGVYSRKMQQCSVYDLLSNGRARCQQNVPFTGLYR